MRSPDISPSYTPTPAELAEVDPRWHDLPDDQQDRVSDLMLTVVSIPMKMAIDAILASDKQPATR